MPTTAGPTVALTAFAFSAENHVQPAPPPMSVFLASSSTSTSTAAKTIQPAQTQKAQTQTQTQSNRVPSKPDMPSGVGGGSRKSHINEKRQPSQQRQQRQQTPKHKEEEEEDHEEQDEEDEEEDGVVTIFNPRVPSASIRVSITSSAGTSGTNRKAVRIPHKSHQTDFESALDDAELGIKEVPENDKIDGERDEDDEYQHSNNVTEQEAGIITEQSLVSIVLFCFVFYVLVLYCVGFVLVSSSGFGATRKTMQMDSMRLLIFVVFQKRVCGGADLNTLKTLKTSIDTAIQSVADIGNSFFRLKETTHVCVVF